jgi:hypothetical protein
VHLRIFSLERVLTRYPKRWAVAPSASFPHTSYVRTLAALLHSCRTKVPERVLNLLLSSTFYLQIDALSEWSRWDSNPRPPPCKGRNVCPRLFTMVRTRLCLGVVVTGVLRWLSRYSPVLV